MNPDNPTTSQVHAALGNYNDGHRKANEFYQADQDRATESRDLRRENIRTKLALGLLQTDARFVVFKRERSDDITFMLAAPTLDEVTSLLVAAQGGSGSLFGGNVGELIAQAEIDPAHTSLLVISIGSNQPLIKHAAQPSSLIEIPQTTWSEDYAYLILCLPDNLAPRTQAVMDFLDIFIAPQLPLSMVCKHALVSMQPVGVIDEATLRRHIVKPETEE